MFPLFDSDLFPGERDNEQSSHLTCYSNNKAGISYHDSSLPDEPNLPYKQVYNITKQTEKMLKI